MYVFTTFIPYFSARSAASSAILEEDKPKFALQLKNVAVNEGETARMECVIVGRPEPVVVKFCFAHFNSLRCGIKKKKQSEKMHVTDLLLRVTDVL